MTVRKGKPPGFPVVTGRHIDPNTTGGKIDEETASVLMLDCRDSVYKLGYAFAAGGKPASFGYPTNSGRPRIRVDAICGRPEFVGRTNYRAAGPHRCTASVRVALANASGFHGTRCHEVPGS